MALRRKHLPHFGDDLFACCWQQSSPPNGLQPPLPCTSWTVCQANAFEQAHLAAAVQPARTFIKQTSKSGVAQQEQDDKGKWWQMVASFVPGEQHKLAWACRTDQHRDTHVIMCSVIWITNSFDLKELPKQHFKIGIGIMTEQYHIM